MGGPDQFKHAPSDPGQLGTVFVANSSEVETDISKTLHNDFLILDTVAKIGLINEIVIGEQFVKDEVDTHTG